jgi:hypothetical protein
MTELMKELTDEAQKVPYDSQKYWKLRALYCEKIHDPTYSDLERSNCYNLHRILQHRHK